jgi:NADH-quinone oxidoreductase subunit J
MDSAAFVFYFLAFVIVLSAYKVVTSPNPIYSALHLAISMIALAGMFFQLGAPFIAGVQLIVYAGAVMVLFVMVVMLFDLKHELQVYSKGAIGGLFKIAASACLAGLIIGAIPLSTDVVQTAKNEVVADTPTKDLALLLFTKYVFSFEALGLLLLLVAVGVVAVSRIKGGTHART